jgi:SAM-dependent methyltransferase
VWGEARSRGPFGWQGNNSTRVFEYPWAYHAIRRAGSNLRILEVGGGLSGLQFVLAREGYFVVNVDPGQDSLGWQYQSDLHRRLCRAYDAPVELFPKKIDSLELPPHSFDVILSVSALEHFCDPDLATLAGAIKRLLKPDGIAVLTVDLFLDLKPFSGRDRNVWGRNFDVRDFLCTADLRLEEGNPAELLGFPEFNPAQIMGNLATYLLGEPYPALSQCVVGRPNCHD